MPASEGFKSYHDENSSRLLNISAAAIVILCLSRSIFCALAPDVLSGQSGIENDTALALVALFFMAAGFNFVYPRKNTHVALILLTISFYILNSIAAFKTQFILFHVGREFPFIDENLAAWDRAMGFNWSNYFEWIVSHPAINWVLTKAYLSIWYQPLLLTAFFVWRRRVREYGRLQIALPLSFGLVCLVATFLPAIGAYQFHEMTPDRHLGVPLAFSDGMTAPMLWLRQAELPPLMPDFPDLRLITFPSWHAAVAVVFILSAWTLPSIRWFSLALNILMLAATPVQGSHYLSDMIVGAGIGGVAFAVAAWALAPGPFARLIALVRVAPAATRPVTGSRVSP